MKLRLKGNSLRLRLTQSEVRHACAGRTVSEETWFPGSVVFRYQIVVAGNVTGPVVKFERNCLTVMLDSQTVEQWATTEQVDIAASVELDGGGALGVLIEKDFRCLDRVDVEEQDMFPNPHATCQ